MTERVTVLGAGTMGHGIALVAAQAGHPTTLYDIADEPLEQGMASIDRALAKGVERGKVSLEERDQALSKLYTSTDLAAAVDGTSLVIEAIPEDLALKQSTFQEVQAHAPPDALLATNTSSLSIASIAEALDDPARFCGMHFFNPPYIMALVEVVQGPASSDETIERAVAWAEQAGKTPIVVQDAPGFASSRLGLALGLEAIRMVEDGVASPEAIDTAMELGYRHPMGPLKLTDLIGLDVRLDIAEYLAGELGERFEPPKLLEEMVADGKLGKKSGEGFYSYE